MKTLKKGMFILLGLSIATACSSDDDTTIASEPTTITELSMDTTITGNVASVTPSSIGGTSYSVDFGNEAASGNEDVVLTPGSPAMYTYPTSDVAKMYTITTTASSATAESVSLTVSIEIAAYVPPATDALGRWVLLHDAGALAVGPTADDFSWWTNGASDVTTRDCLFDDVYEFKADGSFVNTVGDATWLEGFSNNGGDEECGAPTAPYDGSATASWAHDEADQTITISGKGAFLGLSKVFNEGEFTAEGSNFPTAGKETIVYSSVTFSDDKNTMTVKLDYTLGYWKFVFAREGTPGASLSDKDTDGDGVIDAEDSCPDVAGLPDNDGCPATTSRDNAMDDFEGAGNVAWSPDGGTTFDAAISNPSNGGINTSNTVLKYNDNGDQYANIRFDLAADHSEKFDLTAKNIFKVKVFVPTPVVGVTQPLQLALKLQDGSEAEPWNGQKAVIQTYTYDTWQELTFDFSDVSAETKYSRIVVQFNGENNTEIVEAYIDDISQN